MKTKNYETEAGISLYMSVIVLSTVLAIGLGISAILISQLKIASGMEDSMIALFAADTGIERMAFATSTQITASLDNGAGYDVRYLSPGPTCTGSFYCLKSVGVYRQTRRAIEVIR